MSEGNYWAVLTAPILESDTVSDGAKLFYAQVSRRTKQNGYCWASNRTLSEELGIGERTVSRYVAELEAAGFITTEFAGVCDRKRRYERHIRVAVPAPFNLAKNGEVKVAKNGEVKVAKNGEVKVAKNGEVNNRMNNKINNTPLEPPQGGREPEKAKWMPDRFEAFWAYYRQNVNPANRAAARKAWDKLSPDESTIHAIGMALKRRLETDSEWQRGIGRPHASTYLNGQMWLDTWPEAGTPVSPTSPAPAQEEAFGVWH